MVPRTAPREAPAVGGAGPGRASAAGCQAALVHGAALDVDGGLAASRVR
jgi:hypothetical protein